MISKAEIKRINTLGTKKGRQKLSYFVAESPKLIKDILNSQFNISKIFATEEFADEFPKDLLNIVSKDELNKISFLKNPQGVLALIEIPEKSYFENKGLVLALDAIQDPGNLGTILRLAHWFGIKNVICSNDTADLYNPKVIQSSMAAFAYTNVLYTDLAQFLSTQNKPIYGALMNGKNAYSQELINEAILVMGNEGNGIRKEILPLISHPISIPDYPLNKAKIDSLNVSIATAILCGEFRRRLI